MSETTFTPGPWMVRYLGNPHLEDCPEFRVTTSGDGYITTVDSSRSENSKNAHLIAAAPDLYEALEQAVTSMQDSGYSNDHVAVRAARAALAKARGEQ